PFRQGQSPLTRIYPSAAEIGEDMASLAGRVRSLRTYTSQEGLEVVPELAEKHGLKVAMGAWLTSSKDAKGRRINESEVAALIALANRNPATIERVIVGNEVLLRNDLGVEELAGHIRRVRRSVRQPVSYADVWEFWLRNPALAAEVDFITVHFLPYWEDRPVGVEEAMAHILAVHGKVRAAFPDKPILIGEVGWPSHGRSREAARPGRWMQAEFVNAFRHLAHAHGLDYNVVEAFDQPWKVKLEGTVGGNWGLLDIDRQPKFPLGGPVIEHPDWPVPALGSVLLMPLLLLLALRRGAVPARGPDILFLVLLAQLFAAILVAAIWLGHQHAYDWLRAASALLHVLLQSVMAVLLLRRAGGALADRARLPEGEAPRSIRASLGALAGNWALYLPSGRAVVSPAKLGRFAGMRLTWAIEWLLLLFLVLALYQTFMLVFFGRYRDFPVEFFALPAFGLPLAAAFAAVRAGGFAERLGGALLTMTGREPLLARLRPELILLGLTLLLLCGLLLRERPWNREALAWGACLLGLALPLVARLWRANSVSGARRREAI
ncbi:MAG: glycoside hydrolase, partial [Alphaproteobacteria bacterium]|nr:glycoside hydrolase [Alphaproteobacteria bacterium]